MCWDLIGSAINGESRISFRRELTFVLNARNKVCDCKMPWWTWWNKNHYYY